jgi:hypothetical protein
MSNNFFLPKSCHYRGNVRKYGRARQATDDNIIQLMRVACWTIKITYTHLEYVILVASPWQQYLREHVSVLRLYVPCLTSYNYGQVCCRYFSIEGLYNYKS